MRMTKLQPTPRLVVLLLLWLGALGVTSTPVAQTPPDSQGQQTLQHAIIEGLATGRDVSDLLQTLRHQPVPLARPPLPQRLTAAADLQAQLLAFRQVLEQTTQSSVSASALTSLERAYQQVQAAHMLIQAHFHSVAQQLSEAAAPAPFEVRRQSTASHYDALLGQLLTPLAGAMAQLRETLDREELAATAAFREALQQATQETLALLLPHLQEPPRPILRAQTLPVRPASFAPRPPRLSPTIQPSYLQPDLRQAAPTPADLAETPETPFHAEILTQAQALEHDYIRIYEFVRNEIATEWYAGAMKGALGTLRQKSANAVDQASLLIALLRASSAPARYVHGVIRLPLEQVMASLGLTEATQATRALTAAGMAYRPVLQGGRVAAVDLESTWVAARVPYTNYRGAAVDTSGPLWIPLMPALKAVQMTPTTQILRTMGTAVDALLNEYLAQPQPTDLRTHLEQLVTAYLQTHGQTATYAQQLGAFHIVPAHLGLLPTTLPVTVMAVTAEGPALDEDARQRLRFIARAGLQDNAPMVLDYTVAVSEVAGEQLALSYIPATVDDQQVTNLYGGLDYVPAYLIKLRPQFSRNGRPLAVATGILDTGAPYRFEVHLLGPAGSEQSTQTLIAGAYHALSISAQAVTPLTVDPRGLSSTETLADALLARVAHDYSAQWTEAEQEFAGLLDVTVLRPWPAVTLVSNALRVETVVGQPHQLTWQGVTLDVAMHLHTPIARGAVTAPEHDWLRLSALQGSILEHDIFEQLFLVDSISADKGLQLARAQGMVVHHLDALNAAALFPSLRHPQDVLDHITTWVSLGMTVTVPVEPIQHHAWQGSVWHVDDPASGAGGYFIAGELAGGATSEDPTAWALTLLRDALAAPNTARANRDPHSAASITKLARSDHQEGEVGTALAQPLAVLVRDKQRRPVAGAQVTFTVTAGGGCVQTCPTTTVQVSTDAQGLAPISLVLGKQTADNPTYVRRQPADDYTTRAGINLVDAAVEDAEGHRIRIDTPFVALAYPKPAVQLKLMSNGGTSLIPGVANGWVVVQAFDPYDNPVSNVIVTYTAPSAATQTPPRCQSPPSSDPASEAPYVSTHFLGVRNQGACPFALAPVAGECGNMPYSEPTSVFGNSVTLIAARGTMQETITIQAAGLPALSFTYRLNLDRDPCIEDGTHHLLRAVHISASGSNLHAARVGTGSRVPVRMVLLRGSDKKGYQRAEAAGRVDVELDTGPACIKPNPMRYAGQGIYETFVRTALTPGDNQVHPIVRNPNGSVSLADILPGVVGLRLQLTGIRAQEVVDGLAPTLLYLDATNRSQFATFIQYSVAPDSYKALDETIDIFADGMWAGYLTTMPRLGTAGQALLRRGLVFDPQKTYAVQVVLNRGTAFEVRSKPFTLPLRPKLLAQATQRLRVQQDVDIVNERSCVQSTPLAFTLNEAARVSLVFAQHGPPHATATLLDNRLFSAGRHALPFFLPAVAPTGDPASLYSLVPGKYLFALTAIATGTPTLPGDTFPRLPDTAGEIPGCPALDDPLEPTTPLEPLSPNQDAVAGQAFVEYHTDRLPVGRTLVNDVDVATGSLTLSRTDLEVPGRGIPLAFRRTYSVHSSAIPGQMGVGWRHNYEARLEQNLCGDITVSSDTGTVRFVRGQSAGDWQPLKGYHGTLQQTGDTFDFYSVNGTRYHFVPQVWLGRPGYRLDFIADTNGNATRLGYDPTETTYVKLVTVEDPAARTLTFTYNQQSLDIAGLPNPISVITAITGSDGQTLRFTYDQRGNLTSAIRDGGARIETYSYTADRTLVIDPTSLNAVLHGRLAAVTNPNGHTTTYSHDDIVHSPVVRLFGAEIGSSAAAVAIPVPSTAVTSLTAPARGTTQFQYDVAQHRTTVLNSRGAATIYRLNAAGAVIAVDDPVGGITTTAWLDTEPLPTSRTNARGITTAYTYDVHGNVLTETVAALTTSLTYALLGNGTIKNRVTSQSDRNGQVSRFVYDARGNLLQTIDAAGGVTTHTYALNGDRLSTQDPNGNITRYTYDRYGNVATVTDALGGVTRLDWDVRSRPITRTDALGRTTTTVYDTLNRPVQRLDPMGQVHTLTYDPVGNLLQETDAAGRTTFLAYDPANRLVQRTNALGDIQTFTYDTQGNKTSETNFRGHVTTFSYDAADRLLQRTAPLGRVTTLTYDPVGNMLSETDALGRITTFTYDAFNRRLTTSDALGGVTTMRYDGEGNVLAQTDANGHTTTLAYDARHRLVQRTDPLAQSTRYTYDANGNQLTETDANNQRRTREYDRLNRLLRRTNALGHVTAFEYDAVGNLTREINARLHATAHEYDALNRRIKTTDPARSVWTYAYDPVGNRTAEHLPNGNVVVSSYDALDRLVLRTDTPGMLASYAYDADGNRIAETDANGNLTRNTYDALNQLVEQALPADRLRTFAYDRVGNKVAETDANGHLTTFAYDARNRLTTRTDPLGHTVTRTYDAVGNRLTETDPRGHTTTFSYDARNRLTQTTDALAQTTKLTYDPVGNILTETDKRGTATTFTYDRENRRLTTTKAGVTRQTLEYDPVGNVAFETDANGNTTVFLYDPRNLRVQESRPLAAITAHTYDAMGDRVTTRDPEGHTTRLTYDLRRRVLTETNGAGETTTYTYDGNGNRLSRRRPLGNTWTYTYDAANRLTAVTDPLRAITAYTYDGNGNRLTHTDANDHTTSFEYDALNRLVTQGYADDVTANYVYDEAGNRITETDPNGKTVLHTYDALNRRIRTDYPTPVIPTGDDLEEITTVYDENNNLLQVIETSSGAIEPRLTTRTYDPLDRLLATTDLDGQTVRSTYDAQGNRLTVTAPDGHFTRSTYDALNRLTSVTAIQGVTEYAYDRASRLTRTTYPPGTTATQDYDATSRVTRMVHTHHGAPIATYAYAYDANGNRTTQRVTQGGAEEVTAYTYDAANRLLAVVYPDVTTTYTYDAAGNRLTEYTIRAVDGRVMADRIYAYNARHQVTTLTDPQGSSPTVTFTYDATGNRTQQTIGAQTNIYLYNPRNQLRQIIQDDVLVGDFQYDWQGLRVRKTTPTAAVRYVYDGLAPLLVTNDMGTLQSRYTYGPERLLAVEEPTDGPQYALADGLGSVTALGRSDGSLQTRYQYDAWGQYQVTAGHSANRLSFTGHEYDQDSGLYYAKARYYDPVLGVFLSPDTGRGDLTQPLSLQPYLYALQNPTGYVDPTGDIAFLNNLVGGAVSVGVGVVLSRVTGKEYTFTDALVDFGLGFGTSGLSAVAKVRQVQQLGRVGQAATRLAAEATFNVGAEAARQGLKGEEISLPDLAQGAVVNTVIGEAGAQLAQRVLVPAGRRVSDTVFRTGADEAGEIGGQGVRQASVVSTTEEVVESQRRPGSSRQELPAPANQADAVPQGEIPGARGADVEPDVFRYEDFADRVTQSRAETQARYGFTEASDDIVMMARERANPHDIRFTQDTISPHFSDRPGTINDTIQALREGRITPDDIPPIKVVEYKGQLWTLDNRRLASFQYAGVKDIPIIRVDLQ